MDAEIIRAISKSGIYAQIKGLVEFTEEKKGQPPVTSVVGTYNFSRAWVVGEVMDPVEGHSLKVYAGANYWYLPFRLIRSFQTSNYGVFADWKYEYHEGFHGCIPASVMINS